MMKKISKFFKRVYLFPVFMLLGVDGDAGGADGGSTDGGTGGNDDGGASGNDGGQTDDVSTLFSPEEIQAKKEAMTAAKAEEDRRAALTDEEREAEDKAKAEAEAANVVPEEYADFTLPDGMQVDTDLLGEFKPLAKELGLTQANAQKVVDLYTKAVEGQANAWKATIDGWAGELMKDKDLGGEKLETTRTAVQRVVQRFGNEALEKASEQFGFGLHPEMIRFLVKIDAAMSEPNSMPPNNGTGKGKSTAEVLYGGN